MQTTSFLWHANQNKALVSPPGIPHYIAPPPPLLLLAILAAQTLLPPFSLPCAGTFISKRPCIVWSIKSIIFSTTSCVFTQSTHQDHGTPPTLLGTKICKSKHSSSQANRLQTLVNHKLLNFTEFKVRRERKPENWKHPQSQVAHHLEPTKHDCPLAHCEER